MEITLEKQPDGTILQTETQETVLSKEVVQDMITSEQANIELYEIDIQRLQQQKTTSLNKINELSALL